MCESEMWPMVKFSVRQVPRRMIGTDAFQETPIVEVTRQITKHNYLVMDIADLPRVMKEVRTLLCVPCYACPVMPAVAWVWPKLSIL